MILFMHGLLSNRFINTKYKAIKHKKICKTVHYHKLKFNDVSNYYDMIIHKNKPKLIVGHSMGGYWAIKKSKEHNIPCLVMNPYFMPNRYKMFSDYVNLDENDLTHNVNLYIEMGDLILDMKQIKSMADIKKCNYEIHHGGSHFIKYTDRMNQMIDRVLGDLKNG